MRKILLFIILLVIISCSEDRVDRLIDIKVEPELISFDLLKENNSFLDNDIHFKVDTIGDTLVFKADYLKWIESGTIYFIPSFVFQGDRVTFDDQNAVSGKTMISLSDDISCVVSNSDGNSQKYIIRFICPQVNSELPVIRFSVNSNDIINKESYITTSIDIYSQKDPNVNCHYEEGEIRGRGNSTWLLPKKPYRIKFPEKVSPLGLSHTKAKDWVILSHDMDKSLLRNHLAFKISEVFFDKNDSFHTPHTITFTPCSQFVNVYFGDEYHGVYQFTDQKEKGKGRIDVETLGTEQGDDINIIRGGAFFGNSFFG